MPVISITLLPGYDNDTRERLVSRVAMATRSVIAAPSAGTTVYVQEVATYQRDQRIMRAGGVARPVASDLVRDFLDRMAERDLVGASAHLAEGFTMHFPGARPMRRLEELVEWSRSRYQHIRKTYERFDECWADDAAVVYCFGTLHGVWPNGSPFDGIRFIDRFEVSDGLLTRQDVWNDLGEVRGQRPPEP